MLLLVLLQVAFRRAEAMKWQQMQQAHSMLQGQQQQLVAEIQEWKARYRDEAAYSSELQAAANRLQSELTAAHLESQVPCPYSLYWYKVVVGTSFSFALHHLCIARPFVPIC